MTTMKKEMVKDIRQTLTARIIPSLPATPNTNDDRDRTREVINRFEFDYYLEQAHRAGRQEKLNKLIREIEIVKSYISPTEEGD